MDLLAVAQIAAGNYVKTHPHMWPQYEELLADAALGACAAAHRHDPAGGANWVTYCGHRAKGAIIDGLRKRSPLSRGDYARGISTDDMPECRRTPVPLHLLTEHGLREPTAPSMEDAVADTDLVQRMLATCTERERIILSASLLHGYTLTAIAEHLGVTVSAISQQRTAAMGRLRTQFADCRVDAA